jgi:hypothetical protein
MKQHARGEGLTKGHEPFRPGPSQYVTLEPHTVLLARARTFVEGLSIGKDPGSQNGESRRMLRIQTRDEGLGTCG